MRNKGMIEAFRKRGYAIIAPSGLKRPQLTFWTGLVVFAVGEKQRDELAFTREVLADAANRHNIDRQNVLMSGFSTGGSLVWYLACQDPESPGLMRPLPVHSGGPIPSAQIAPVRSGLLHTHGWRDKTVPLEGRPLGGGRVYQGDVFEGLRILREINGCNQLRADTFNTKGTFLASNMDEVRSGVSA